MNATVADLFCGGGFMSSGFEAAGFKVVYGLDNWEPAVKTFKSNFRRAQVVMADALTVDPEEIPDVDVIIGGPPCRELSKANLKKPEEPDLSLIEYFLEVVKVKKPRWWIMENVPPVLKYLPDGIMKNSYRMCDYGVPQIRSRVFAGHYREPRKSPINVAFPAVVATEYKGSRYMVRRGKKYTLTFSNIFKRRAMLPECMIAQTIPIDWILHGTLIDRYKLVGNAVPPFMAYRLAEALIDSPQQLLSDKQEGVNI